MNKILSKIFEKQIQTEVSHRCRNHLNLEREVREKNTKRQFEFIELSSHVGNFVISIPNEIENLSVIKITDIEFITEAQCPVLVGFDIMRNKQMMLFGKVYSFTEQKFDAFNNMHPNSRIAIVYDNHFDKHVDKSKTQEEALIDPVVWKKRVMEKMKHF